MFGSFVVRSSMGMGVVFLKIGNKFSKIITSFFNIKTSFKHFPNFVVEFIIQNYPR